MDKYNEKTASELRRQIHNNSIKAMAYTGLAIAGIALIYHAKKPNDASEKVNIQAEGFPKGYHIENVEIPTRGQIIRVEKLPGENYQTIVDEKTGTLTFKGNFEYEIKPLRSAMPKDPYHSDIRGRTPQNNEYWTAIREGKITLTIDRDSLESKVNK